MRYLIDTHVLIWHAENQNLSQEELDIINNPQNTIYCESRYTMGNDH
jgi:PIN domain nuclease of toxin-antitoxin system